ncbi:hypothetical protein ABIB53_001795 [Janibacter sp. UYMM211]
MPTTAYDRRVSPSQPSPEVPRDTAVARATAPLVRWVSGLPPVVPVLGVFALVLLGAVVPGWGWVFLALAVLVLVWVLAISWPRLTPSEKMLRLAVIVLCLAITVVRAVPR